jgi:hypothetical protein
MKIKVTHRTIMKPTINSVGVIIVHKFVKFTAVKITVFFSVTPGSFIDRYQRFVGTRCLYLHARRSGTIGDKKFLNTRCHGNI